MLVTEKSASFIKYMLQHLPRIRSIVQPHVNDGEVLTDAERVFVFIPMKAQHGIECAKQLPLRIGPAILPQVCDGEGTTNARAQQVFGISLPELQRSTEQRCRARVSTLSVRLEGIHEQDTSQTFIDELSLRMIHP